MGKPALDPIISTLREVESNLLQRGAKTKAELDDTIGKADFTLLAQADDPAPGKIFSKKIRLSMLKQRTLKLLKGKR